MSERRNSGPGGIHLLHLAGLGLGIGVLAGLWLSAVRLAAYAGAGFPRILLHGGLQALNQMLPLGLGVAVSWGVVHRLLARRVTASADRVRQATRITGALVSLVALVELNRSLPGASTSTRVAANLGLVLTLLAGVWWTRATLSRAVSSGWGRSATAAVLLGALAWAGLNAAVQLAPADPSRPNLIVILIDVLRADHLGSYGYSRDTSPNIDALAADSVVFDRAIAQSTFTKTSVSSLFTGLYPYRHGVYRGDRRDERDEIHSDVLAAEHATVAEELRALGWTTAAWVHNAHLRAYLGFDQGFVDYFDQPGRLEKIRRGFQRWREKLGRIDPFFAYFHVIDLHGPNQPRPAYAGRFGRYSEEWSSLSQDGYSTLMRQIRAGERLPDEAGVEQLRADYDAVLAYVDDQVGQLLEVLREEGLYDDSLIVLTSDHGDAFMEHGIVGHSWTPHDELIHVPLLVKLPQSEGAGRRVAPQVRLVDVAPTLIELAGGTPVPEMDGVSLAPLLESASGTPPPPIAVSEHGKTIVARTEEWKYLRPRREGDVLYDLRADPGELRNVIDEHPETAEMLRQVVDQVETGRQGRAAEERVLDPDTVEALRALGYVE